MIVALCVTLRCEYRSNEETPIFVCYDNDEGTKKEETIKSKLL